MSDVQLRRRENRGEPSGWPDSVHPRGVLEPAQAEHRLARLLSPQLLGGMAQAVQLLTEAIRDDWTILIAGDYDCDGATGTAVAVRGLRLLGARRVSYAIPNRFTHGYGLSAAFVASLQPTPQLIVTVDNGVASMAGVAAAKARGIRVIVTDHHLPGEQLPDCDAIVNPNLVGDPFPSKMLAGVGVMFYLLLALRAQLYPSDHPDGEGQAGAIHVRSVQNSSRPDLSGLLDLVALGTVADLVPLDFNNRVLVEAGLQRMRSGRACAGITALIEAGKRSLTTLCASDLGFAVGPRLNAAGRLEDMRLGVECLLTEAEQMVVGLSDIEAIGVALFEPSWHAGVVGLVASKLKERLHRPVIAFAPASEDDADHLRGSARSIPGFHIRDALAAIDAREPGLIERFGGHAMAAGLSLKTVDYPRFAAAFDAVVRELIEPVRLQAILYTDECHLRLQLRDPRDGAVHDAVMFNAYHGQPPPSRLRAAYELVINDWQGRERPRLLLRHIEAA